MRTFFWLLAMLVATSASAQSQYDPQTWFQVQCPKCFVVAYVDVPAPTQTISRTDLLSGLAQFQGWGFQCYTGAGVDRVEIWIETSRQFGDGTYEWEQIKQAGTVYGGSYRPDVAAAYVSYCPNVSLFSGYSLYVTNWPREYLGAHRVQFVAWNGPYHTAVIRTYNITE
jgi:hypothetical protein